MTHAGITPTGNASDRAQQLQAMFDGKWQEWEVTYYEVDESGDRKTGPDEAAHSLTRITSPIVAPRVVAHTAFHVLHTNPDVPEVHVTDYDIERVRLLTAEEYAQA